jgi:hypothetical protein
MIAATPLSTADRLKRLEEQVAMLRTEELESAKPRDSDAPS